MPRAPFRSAPFSRYWLSRERCWPCCGWLAIVIPHRSDRWEPTCRDRGGAVLFHNHGRSTRSTGVITCRSEDASEKAGHADQDAPTPFPRGWNNQPHIQPPNLIIILLRPRHLRRNRAAPRTPRPTKLHGSRLAGPTEAHHLANQHVGGLVRLAIKHPGFLKGGIINPIIRVP